MKTNISSNNSGRFIDVDPDKLRGGYYTAPEIANWLCAWAIRNSNDRLLEPSCGDGIFLSAAAERLSELGVPNSGIYKQITGIEIIANEADRARSRLKELLGSAGRNCVANSDFFAWWQAHEPNSFDAVVGNPPFIRYQTFPEPCRGRAMEIMKGLGLSPNQLTNIWVPFVVAAYASLRPGGRLALVLPAELLQVTYASQLRSFLTDRFARIDIIACNELFFKKAEQEVVLLLADGALPSPSETNPCRVTLTETRTLEEITNRPPELVLAEAQPKTVHHDHEKWLKYFLTQHEISFMRELRSSNVTTPLGTHASVNVGVVTGKNEFFVLNKEQITELELREDHTAPLVSRSVQLRGARIDKTDWKELSAAGNRVHLLHLEHLKGKKPKGGLARYIQSGESRAVHKGYKCSIRTPWYTVPSVWIPDGFVFRQIYDFPRIVLNQAEATSTDTIHRLRSKAEDPERIIANTYTWLTAASAEIEGRSYGGGVLELEPTEAERLMMPAKLNGALPISECDRLTRSGKLNEVLEENARIVLMNGMGLSQSDCDLLRSIWEKMRDRRLARRRTGRKPPKVSMTS